MIGEWPVPESKCPQCGHWLDGTTNPHDPNAIPRPGDVTICILCGQLCMFDKMLHLRRMKRSEFHALSDTLKGTMLSAVKFIADREGKKLVTIIVDEDEDRPPKGVEMGLEFRKKK